MDEGFSILWWIELVLRATVQAHSPSSACTFQYPLVDRVGFEGSQAIRVVPEPLKFQYPLVDRVGFEGHTVLPPGLNTSISFQYPLVDRVGFEGTAATIPGGTIQKFQYPLVDRVGFEGTSIFVLTLRSTRFQYPLVDRVGFEGTQRCVSFAGRCVVSVSSGGSSWF